MIIILYSICWNIFYNSRYAKKNIQKYNRSINYFNKFLQNKAIYIVHLGLKAVHCKCFKNQWENNGRAFGGQHLDKISRKSKMYVQYVMLQYKYILYNLYFYITVLYILIMYPTWAPEKKVETVFYLHNFVLVDITQIGKKLHNAESGSPHIT